MPSYTPAPEFVHDLINEIKERYHPDLVKAGVTVNALFAYAKKGDAVKLHGYPCHAVVKKNSPRDRVQGLCDATITIDQDSWEDLDEAEREALIDHELHHLVVEPIGSIEEEDDRGRKTVRVVYKTDDAHRPVIRLRLHDWQLGGFRAIAERHGGSALEVQAFRNATDTFRQQVFAWSDDQAPQDQPSGTIGHPFGARTA